VERNLANIGGNGKKPMFSDKRAELIQGAEEGDEIDDAKGPLENEPSEPVIGGHVSRASMPGARVKEIQFMRGFDV